jgi:hypothetical protein
LQEAHVDPLIRKKLMGHAPAGERSAGHDLGMTAVYTHAAGDYPRRKPVSVDHGRMNAFKAVATNCGPLYEVIRSVECG